MIEVFITDVLNKIQADRILTAIQNDNSDLKINVELNETKLSFPCGHTILRVEGDNVNSEKILMTVNYLGFNCEILEDKVCI